MASSFFADEDDDSDPLAVVGNDESGFVGFDENSCNGFDSFLIQSGGTSATMAKSDPLEAPNQKRKLSKGIENRRIDSHGFNNSKVRVHVGLPGNEQEEEDEYDDMLDVIHGGSSARVAVQQQLQKDSPGSQRSLDMFYMEDSNLDMSFIMGGDSNAAFETGTGLQQSRKPEEVSKAAQINSAPNTPLFNRQDRAVSVDSSGKKKPAAATSTGTPLNSKGGTPASSTSSPPLKGIVDDLDMVIDFSQMGSPAEGVIAGDSPSKDGKPAVMVVEGSPSKDHLSNVSAEIDASSKIATIQASANATLNDRDSPKSTSTDCTPVVSADTLGNVTPNQVNGDVKEVTVEARRETPLLAKIGTNAIRDGEGCSEAQEKTIRTESIEPSDEITSPMTVDVARAPVGSETLNDRDLVTKKEGSVADEIPVTPAEVSSIEAAPIAGASEATLTEALPVPSASKLSVDSPIAPVPSVEMEPQPTANATAEESKPSALCESNLQSGSPGSDSPTLNSPSPRQGAPVSCVSDTSSRIETPPASVEQPGVEIHVPTPPDASTQSICAVRVPEKDATPPPRTASEISNDSQSSAQSEFSRFAAMFLTPKPRKDSDQSTSQSQKAKHNEVKSLRNSTGAKDTEDDADVVRPLKPVKLSIPFDDESSDLVQKSSPPNKTSVTHDSEVSSHLRRSSRPSTRLEPKSNGNLKTASSSAERDAKAKNITSTKESQSFSDEAISRANTLYNACRQALKAKGWKYKSGSGLVDWIYVAPDSSTFDSVPELIAFLERTDLPFLAPYIAELADDEMDQESMKEDESRSDSPRRKLANEVKRPRRSSDIENDSSEESETESLEEEDEEGELDLEAEEDLEEDWLGLWNACWTEMRNVGWKHKAGRGLVDWVFTSPDGKNEFHSEEELMRFVKAHRPSIFAYALNELRQRRKRSQVVSQQQNAKRSKTDGPEAESEDDLEEENSESDEEHEEEEEEEAQTGPVVRYIEDALTMDVLWKHLRKNGWTYRAGRGLATWLYCLPGCSKPSHRGKDHLVDPEELFAFCAAHPEHLQGLELEDGTDSSMVGFQSRYAAPTENE